MFEIKISVDNYDEVKMINSKIDSFCGEDKNNKDYNGNKNDKDNKDEDINVDTTIKTIDNTIDNPSNKLQSTLDVPIPNETLYGRLQIMRVKSDNLSLTDKYEFFRFMPIKRGELV